MSGASRIGMWSLVCGSIKTMDLQAVNTAQVFKAMERDSSFFYLLPGLMLSTRFNFHA